ncbi:MAG: tetratricopeptide repeat protein [Lachnospiraceae bacterium]|jgi:tetratricopeptide (TPR) repeat protein|nr:tetratricopeptide repeat protein [Lachnospiraceae bacterium]
MSYIKKHPHFIILTLGTVIALICGAGFVHLLMGYLAYAVFMYFVRLPLSIGWTGYVFQFVFRKQKWAIPLYRYALKHRASCSSPLIAYGLYLLEECHYEEALTAFQHVVTLPKVNPTMLKFARQDLAIAYWKTGDLATGISTLEQMQKDYEFFNLEFYTTLGYFYIEAGEYEKAREITDLALMEDEAHGPAYDNLAQIEYRQGHYDEAEALFLKALDLRDTMADSKYYLGLIYEKAGDPDAALAYFTAAHNSRITGLNTVTREQVDAKYQEYIKEM